jgi:uncharacterized membrane protein YcaP (DUF421 family)
MENIFFDSGQSIIRTIVITILAYIAMIFLLRASGKRTLSKMNAFDFIVTIALGSALANVSLNKNVALADGVLAFSLLIFLQYSITWLSVRIKQFKKIITRQPTLLLYRGQVIDVAVKKERITREEIFLAAREKGITQLEDIDALILETTGEITVVKKISEGKTETLQDIENY